MAVIDSDKTKNVRGNRATELLEHISSLFTKEEVIAMLTDLQLEIEEKHKEEDFMNDWASGYNISLIDTSDLIQQKINALKGEKEDGN